MGRTFGARSYNVQYTKHMERMKEVTKCKALTERRSMNPEEEHPYRRSTEEIKRPFAQKRMEENQINNEKFLLYLH